MAGLRFVCLGAGDAFSALWYSSCLAVEAEDCRLLVDCPHPIRKVLREGGAAAGVPLDVGDFAAVALTHLHADHASGLEDFAYYSHFFLKRKVIVLTHPDVATELWDSVRIGMCRGMTPDGRRFEHGADDFFEILPLSDDSPVTFGPFEIACRRTTHPVPTFALRIRAGGRELGLSADTSYDPELIRWLAPCDLIVHETNRGIHTPYEALAALPDDLRRKLRLIHYPDDFDRSASVIECLEQGRLYTV
jgi:ribonuclease BN (tRNA processing enzyme)